MTAPAEGRAGGRSTWRRVRRSRTGARVLRSPTVTAADTARRFVWTARAHHRDPSAFAATRTVLVLIGHVKSGGSLLGALLDAHPDAAIADEADVLRYVEAGFRRDQLLHLLVRGSRTEARKGRVTARRLEPYSLAVPGQWQGKVRVPLVVGDSRAGPTTRRAGDDPVLLERAERRLAPIELRYVHVVRNPLDPISAMVLRSGRSLDAAIADHAAQCDRLERLRQHIPADRLHTVGYEAFLADPRAGLVALCAFLGLDRDPDHLDAATSVVRTDRVAERHRVAWSDHHRAEVAALAQRYAFLNAYATMGPDHAC